MKRLALVVLLPLLISLASCTTNSEQGILMAAGSYSDLAVVLSDARSEPLANRFLAAANPTTRFVIKEETLFRPDIYKPEALELARRYKNVLIVLRIGDGGPVQKEVKKLVSRETWQRLASGSGVMVQLNDPWSTYQTVLVVAAQDRNSLGSYLQNQASSIRAIFERTSRERILRRYRYTGLNTHQMNAYREQLGFSFEIPKEFKQNQFRPKGFNGLELIQKGPSRGITVTWTPHEKPEEALQDREFLLSLREVMGHKMHNEDLVSSTLVWSESTVGDHSAVKLEGAWNSNSFEGGGPFWCYFVADNQRGRVLCLDLLAYAPHMDKMPMFRRMSAIVSTLKMAN